MRKVIFGVLIILVVLPGCSYRQATEEQIPSRLVFTGRSQNWKAELEINQSVNKALLNSYNVEERFLITYLGKDLYELSQDKVGVDYYVEGVLTGEKKVFGRSNSFQEKYGTEKGGVSRGSTNSSRYAKKDDTFQVVVKWGDKTESFVLTYSQEQLEKPASNK